MAVSNKYTAFKLELTTILTYSNNKIVDFSKLGVIDYAFLFVSLSFLYFGLKTLITKKRKFYNSILSSDIFIQLILSDVYLRSVKGKQAVIAGVYYLIVSLVFFVIELKRLII